MLYRWLLKPWLFLLEAETAHRLVIRGLSLLAKLPFAHAGLRAWFGAPRDALRVHALGLEFSSPVGLAAGLDKDAEAYEALGALGFGFIEVGTLTAKAQAGNPRPRLFRLPEDRSLINRMGFNNEGAAAAARRLDREKSVIVGANIGRSRATPNDQARSDYQSAALSLAPHVDYLVLNVSSPNTPELRRLQASEQLRPLVAGVRDALKSVGRQLPLLLKIAPDLSNEELDELCDLSLELGVDGLIATNTTTTREGLSSSPELIERIGAGGLSGRALKARSLEILKRISLRVGNRLTLISVGGIETADDVWERLRAGASLVQIYSALIYEGPGLPAHLHRELARRLEKEGLASISELAERGPASRPELGRDFGAKATETFSSRGH